MVEPEPGGLAGPAGQGAEGSTFTHPKAGSMVPTLPPSIQTARLVWSGPFSPHCIPWNALHPPLASGAPEGLHEAPRVTSPHHSLSGGAAGRLRRAGGAAEHKAGPY